MELAMPTVEYLHYRNERWKPLVKDLFPFVQQQVPSRKPADWQVLLDELDTWWPVVAYGAKFDNADPDDSIAKTVNENWLAVKKYRQWKTAWRLLWCGKLAAASSSTFDQQRLQTWDQIDRILASLDADIPKELKEQSGWTLDCVRLLATGASHPRRSLTSAVALSDDLPDSTGSVATLHLDLLEPGSGAVPSAVFRHPQDCLATYADTPFERAMQVAWEAARSLVASQTGADLLYDGRWRLVGGDGQSLEEVSGPSARGAAALGWYHLFKGTIPDKGIIVLAKIDKSGLLSEVGSIPAKVDAIVEANRTQSKLLDKIDTIVVGSDANRGEAEERLRAMGVLHEEIRVWPPHSNN